MATDPWRVTADGIVLTVRLTPRGGRDRLEGVAEIEGRPLLRARVAAAPVDGAANEALIRLLAKALGVPPSGVAVTSGATARIKQVSVSGDPEALRTRLTSLV